MRLAGVVETSIVVALASLAIGCGATSDEPFATGKGENVGTVRHELVSDDMALHWAPVHYQDVSKSHGNGLNGIGDFITSFRNDGDWVGHNNWDTLGAGPTWRAYAYYTVAETATHWFLGYDFFHSRDWSGWGEQQHENDMEGVVEIVRKDGTQWGRLEAMITVFHNDWRIYRNPATASYLGQGPASSQGIETLIVEPSGLPNDPHTRPMTYQEAEGHGLVGCTNSFKCGLHLNDSVRYQPNAVVADSPAMPDDQEMETARYFLIEMGAPHGLWTHRFDHDAQVSWSNYAGNSSDSCDGPFAACADNAAGTPWSAGTSLGHLLFADPAKVARDFFSGWDNMDPNRSLSLDYYQNDLGSRHSWRSNWVPVASDGQTDTAVAAATLDGRMYVFAKAPGGGAQIVNVSSTDGANWTTFGQVPGGSVTTNAQPAAVTCNQRMYVFVKQSTGETTVRWNFKDQTSLPSTGWSSWQTMPAATTNAAVGLACRAGKVYVFLKGGGDNRIYFNSLNASTHAWGTWNEVPSAGITHKTPAAAVNPTTGELNLVVVGSDSKPWVNRLCSTCGELSWTGWSQHPGWTTTNSPIAVAADSAPGPAGVHLFSRNGENNRIDADSIDNGFWRGPSIVRGHQITFSAPAAARFNDALHLFAVGTTLAAPYPLGYPYNQNPELYRVSDQRIWMTVGNETNHRLLSQGKQALQSSTYADAARALDAHTDGHLSKYYDGHPDGDYFHGVVSHTNQSDFPWWAVDLGVPRTITQVDVWNRTDCCANRLREWSVLVSNDGWNWTKIFNDSRPGGASRLTVVNGYGEMYNGVLPGGTGGTNAGRTIAGLTAWQGRYVAIQINRTGEWLHLAEVQVWGG